MRAARERFPGLPVYAVGHSLFGHVTLAHAARHPEVALAGIALLSCNICNPEWRRRRGSWLLKGALTEALTGVGKLLGRFPARRLRIGSNDEALGYVRDFGRCWRIGDWQARDGFSYYGALPNVRVRVRAWVGAGDRLMSSPADARGLVAPVPGARVHVVGLESGLSFDPGHMATVLDERVRPVWEEIAAFVGQASAVA